MQKAIDVCGLGNAICDLGIALSDQHFSALGFARGSFALTSAAEQADILARLDNHTPQFSAGGSVANSLYTAQGLGGSTAFSGRVGRDIYGARYAEELSRLRIRIAQPGSFAVEGPSGTSVVLTTPDGERTMRTHLGVAADLSPLALDAEVIRHSRWLFIEGYLFANSESARETVKAAVQLATRSDCKIALTLGSAYISSVFKSEIEALLPEISLLIANEHEAAAFTGSEDWSENLLHLKDAVEAVVITGSSKGALISFRGHRDLHVPSFPAKVLDSTGAGDAFAGGLLYGLTHGYDPLHSTRGGCLLASRVIEQYGPRLERFLPPTGIFS